MRVLLGGERAQKNEQCPEILSEFGLSRARLRCLWRHRREPSAEQPRDQRGFFLKMGLS